MDRLASESPVPVPLLGTVLLMLVALAIVKVRVARAVRSRERTATCQRPKSPPREDLPRDPAAALAELKSSGERPGVRS